MGLLTGEMTRLCDEIVALRGARETLLKDLAQWTRGLQDSVSEMQTGFRQAHGEMARKTRAERAAFASGLKKTVRDLRAEVAADLAGARQAWLGPPPAERRAAEQAERSRRAEEARRRMQEKERRAREEEKRRQEAEDRRRREEERRAPEAREESRRAVATLRKEEERGEGAEKMIHPEGRMQGKRKKR